MEYLGGASVHHVSSVMHFDSIKLKHHAIHLLLGAVVALQYLSAIDSIQAKSPINTGDQLLLT